jgi:hypothetical protein
MSTDGHDKAWLTQRLEDIERELRDTVNGAAQEHFPRVVRRAEPQQVQEEPLQQKPMSEHELFEHHLRGVLDHLYHFLMGKNRAYGNSVLQPVRAFSRVDPLEQCNVRLDDKFSRLIFGQPYGQEDTELDITGYLIIKEIIRRIMAHKVEAQEHQEAAHG